MNMTTRFVPKLMVPAPAMILAVSFAWTAPRMEARQAASTDLTWTALSGSEHLASLDRRKAGHCIPRRVRT